VALLESRMDAIEVEQRSFTLELKHGARGTARLESNRGIVVHICSSTN
jgi:hypothetical protein